MKRAMITLMAAFGAIAIHAEKNAPAIPSVDQLLHAVTSIRAGMLETDALAILRTNGFPVVINNGSNQVLSISAGDNFFWTTCLSLSASDTYSLELECVTALHGPDHSHRQGVVKRVFIRSNGTNVTEIVTAPRIQVETEQIKRSHNKTFHPYF